MGKRRIRSATATLAITGLVAGLATNPMTESAAVAATTGATATFAELPGATPNYIFPMVTGPYYSVANLEQFQRLSYRTLYWVGDQGKPVINPKLSLAEMPTYSDNNTVVNVKLGNYKWSDGMPVTSRDIGFWINLFEANKKSIAFYTPGEFPDNLKSYKVTGPESIRLTLTGPVNPTWFTYDQLAQITPIPQQTWDKTSVSGSVGNYDETKSRRRPGVQLPHRPVEGHRHLWVEPSLAHRRRALGAQPVPVGRLRAVQSQSGLLRPGQP